MSGNVLYYTVLIDEGTRTVRVLVEYEKLRTVPYSYCTVQCLIYLPHNLISYMHVQTYSTVYTAFYIFFFIFYLGKWETYTPLLKTDVVTRIDWITYSYGNKMGLLYCTDVRYCRT